MRLAAYGGEASDLHAEVLQQFLETPPPAQRTFPVSHVYGFDEIVEAHRAMEAGTAVGKFVVLTGQ